MARIGDFGRPRRWPVIAVGVVALLALVFVLLSRVLIDLLWFREVDLSVVFWMQLRSKVLLGLVFGLIFFGLLYVNLLIVRSIVPEPRVLTPDQEIVERFRQTVDPYLRWLLPLAVAVVALFVGVAGAAKWQTFLLWRSSSGITFGAPDPLFGRDPAFYVFTLPWLRFVQGWLFSSLVGVFFLTAMAHYLWGGIRPQARAWEDKVTAPVRAHLSVLLALIMLAKSWGYYLGRFDLLTSGRGAVQGASFTDVKAQLPALTFLWVVALICAALFLINIRVRLWSLPVIAVGLLALVSVLLGAAYPTFVQQFRVKPQEQQREEPYIANNIAATRFAFGLDGLDPQERPVDSLVTAAEVDANRDTLSNVRLWRPGVLQQNFQGLQRIKQFYDFKDVDVDRYSIDDQRRVLMVAAREVAQSEIPEGSRTWQNTHLVYTHGFGAVATQANSATAEGIPDFTLKDIPPVGEPLPDQPRVYYAEGNDVPFVVVNTGTPELDYVGSTDPQPYTGQGGIPLGGTLQRALFAIREGDINLLISGQITGDSKILINRDIQSRTHLAAPFLKFDADPYLAIVAGKLVWIWDAYTTTDQYPYSQSVDLAQATDPGALAYLSGSANYIRNSVKVTVDAYDGTVTYYADLDEPIIHAWSNAFPGMFDPLADAPLELQEHFRYPENLFQVQAFQFANYHVTDPAVFYQKTDRWQIPDDPTVPANNPENPTTGPLHPYYLLMTLPGEAQEQFVLFLPFVPQSRQNMVGWMAAKSDPGAYGELVSTTFPEGRNILGPDQVFSQINQDPTFSQQRSLLSTGGSSVIFGDFLAIPLGNSFLYVQPVYVRSNQTDAIPELKRVLVVNGGVVGVSDTFEGALSAAVTGTQSTGGGEQPPQGQTVAELLAQALDHFAAADAALKSGDLSTYQDELAQAQALVKQANDLAAAAASGTQVTATATPSPSG
ncbi:MAG: UPF0182 family protein [Actinobacteria bacterium]|nr:UPF0182 family protein [Actinomycetota bacterium]